MTMKYKINSPKLVPKLVTMNTGMGFLRTNDLSGVKTGEFCLDFKVGVKTVGFDGWQTKI